MSRERMTDEAFAAWEVHHRAELGPSVVYAEARRARASEAALREQVRVLREALARAHNAIEQGLAWLGDPHARPDGDEGGAVAVADAFVVALSQTEEAW